MCTGSFTWCIPGWKSRHGDEIQQGAARKIVGQSDPFCLLAATNQKIDYITHGL